MSLKQHNFIYLLVGMLFLLLVIPLYRDLSGAAYHHVSELTFSVVLIIGVWSLRGKPGWFLAGIVLVVLGVGGNILALTAWGVGFVYLSLCSYIVFLLLTISLAIQQVVRTGTVDANSMIGAVCIYLLLGIIWALFYVMINLLIPGSFTAEITGSAYQQLQVFLYYSFVTLTTLGYGDVFPIKATARALATTEAMFGQFYMATLVAGLVSAYLSADHRIDNAQSKRINETRGPK